MDKSNQEIPLAVDLDGTLIKTDLFFESSVIFLRSNPARLFKMIYWLLFKGRVYLKYKLEKAVDLNFKCLPYNHKAIHWLREEKSKGRKLILVTGSTQGHAEKINSHLNLFEECYGVNLERKRLTGHNKAQFLIQLFGKKNFDYVGNSFIDFHVWKGSRKGMIVGAGFFVRTLAQWFFKIECSFQNPCYFSGNRRFFNSLIYFVNKRMEWVARLFLLCLLFFTFYFLKSDITQWGSAGYASIKNIPFLDSMWIAPFLRISLVATLYYLSVAFLKKLSTLQEDREADKFNILRVIHPYWGCLFLPLFIWAFRISYMHFSCLAAGLFLVYFVLELLHSIDSISRLRKYTYTLLITGFITALYAYILMPY